MSCKCCSAGLARSVAPGQSGPWGDVGVVPGPATLRAGIRCCCAQVSLSGLTCCRGTPAAMHAALACTRALSLLLPKQPSTFPAWPAVFPPGGAGLKSSLAWAGVCVSGPRVLVTLPRSWE